MKEMDKEKMDERMGQKKTEKKEKAADHGKNKRRIEKA